MENSNSTENPPNADHRLATYRPEIDGLRALAVLPVVLYHAKLGFPGGYAGVDVFFTISGFLITSLILKELEADCFSLAGFWERRIRRIFPALIAMVLLTLLAGGILLPPSDYLNLGKSALAQSLVASNFFFWRDDSIIGGYFGWGVDEHPLLHTWSLAIEEQFYLLFPLIMAGLFRFKPFRNPRILSFFILLGLFAGLELSILGMKQYNRATFFLLPTRAWELMCGALVASLNSAKLIPGKIAVRELMSWLGFAGIMVPYWLYTMETPFPGLAALPPCLGTALVIWSNGRPENRQIGLTSVGRLLALTPFVFIGLISYSLYLWHWPILVFGKYWWLNGKEASILTLGLAIGSCLVAVLSWRYVETPFRTKRLMPTRKAAFRFAAAGTLLSFLFSLIITASHGLLWRMPEIVRKNETVKNDKFDLAKYIHSPSDVQQGRVVSLGVENVGAAPKLLLWGDSHAMHAAIAMDSLCRELGIRGYAITYSSTPPLFDAVFKERYGLNEKTPEWAMNVLTLIKQKGISHVVLGGYWSAYQKTNAQLLEKSLTSTIQTLHNAGCQVWVLMDVPDVDKGPVYKILMLNALIRTENYSYSRTVADHLRKNSVVYQLAKENLPATFLDPAPLLMLPSKDRFKMDVGGTAIYFDSQHLTNSASLALLLPLFRTAMSSQLAQPEEMERAKNKP